MTYLDRNTVSPRGVNNARLKVDGHYNSIEFWRFFAEIRLKFGRLVLPILREKLRAVSEEGTRQKASNVTARREGSARRNDRGMQETQGGK